MADKIVQVEEFCMHIKILGKISNKTNPKFDLFIVQEIKYLTPHQTYLSSLIGCITYFWIFVVEIDKRIKFHKVLGLEYMMKMKKYSNTEFLVKSWIMIIIGIVAIIVAFFQTIYNILKGNMGTKNVGG